jgi:hypothetical protein
MPTDFTTEEPFVRVRLLGSELSFPMLADVENFLYDLNLLYEILRLAIDPRYEGFKFSHNVFYMYAVIGNKCRIGGAFLEFQPVLAND